MDKKFVVCMFIENGKAVKSFTDHTIIFDDPVRLAEQYSDDDADALLLFDVFAGENHIQSLLLYKDICDVVNIPVYGGGHINSAEDVADLFTAGCEKVVLNFGKECHDLLRQVADAYGRNRIAVSIASADNIVINKAILEANQNARQERDRLLNEKENAAAAYEEQVEKGKADLTIILISMEKNTKFH